MKHYVKQRTLYSVSRPRSLSGSYAHIPWNFSLLSCISAAESHCYNNAKLHILCWWNWLNCFIYFRASYSLRRRWLNAHCLLRTLTSLCSSAARNSPSYYSRRSKLALCSRLLTSIKPWAFKSMEEVRHYTLTKRSMHAPSLMFSSLAVSPLLFCNDFVLVHRVVTCSNGNQIELAAVFVVDKFWTSFTNMPFSNCSCFMYRIEIIVHFETHYSYGGLQ